MNDENQSGAKGKEDEPEEEKKEGAAMEDGGAIRDDDNPNRVQVEPAIVPPRASSTPAGGTIVIAADHHDDNNNKQEEEAENRSGTAEIRDDTPLLPTNPLAPDQAEDKDASHVLRLDDAALSHLPVLALETTGGSSRPRSPSAYSEISRPDPPSVMDHQILMEDDDDDNDDDDGHDWNDHDNDHDSNDNTPGNAATTAAFLGNQGIGGGTNSKWQEPDVSGDIVQKALAQSNPTGTHASDKDNASCHPPPSPSPLPPRVVDLVPTPQRPPSSTESSPAPPPHPSCREPPAILKHSSSSTHMESIARMNQEALAEGAATAPETAVSAAGKPSHPEMPPQIDRRREILHGPDQESPSPPPPRPPSSTVAPVAIDTEHQPQGVQMEEAPEPTPVMANGKSSLGRPTASSADTAAEDRTQPPTQRIIMPQPPPPLPSHSSNEDDNHTPSQLALAPAPAFVPTPQQHSTAPAPSYLTPYAVTAPAPSNGGGGSRTSPPFMILNSAPPAAAARDGGRRKMNLHLLEESLVPAKRPKRSFLGHFRSRSVSSTSSSSALQAISEGPEFVATDRGHISVSWFAGTLAIELQEHVRRSVIRKLRLPATTQLIDLRLLDESQDPPEGMCVRLLVGLSACLCWRASDSLQERQTDNCCMTHL
jgi:hypothetical protein